MMRIFHVKKLLASGLIPEEEYTLIEKYTMEVFLRGSEIAAQHGLILVDTKYEFGKKDGKIYLIDEINTPDSSRYFYADEYQERFDKGLASETVIKGVCKGMAYGKWFPGKGRTKST